MEDLCKQRFLQRIWSFLPNIFFTCVASTQIEFKTRLVSAAKDARLLGEGGRRAKRWLERSVSKARDQILLVTHEDNVQPFGS